MLKEWEAEVIFGVSRYFCVENKPAPSKKKVDKQAYFWLYGNIIYYNTDSVLKLLYLMLQ